MKEPRFLTSAKGERIKVVIDIDEYEKLIEEPEDFQLQIEACQVLTLDPSNNRRDHSTRCVLDECNRRLLAPV